ncbi:hypothetical protein EDB92DRAFT_1820051 [Lactarius akahatsu]|uniref:Uncharacterized protein n=1 Tax=Lactarius akahatsu TaxID=416441 RepID=A0AAD4Q8Y1_9AGAM|nr:hypothetical protein EDB92DRAFT_1820051 [Lactarius akahatsu]
MPRHAHLLPEHLAALGYPLQDKGVAHEEEVQVMANIGMDALHNPHKPRPKGEWIGGEMTRHYNPVIKELYILSIDMILLNNDIALYNLEQVQGDNNHSIITTTMHHNKTDIQGAMNWVYDYHKELEVKFMDLDENKITEFEEPVDTELAQWLGN